MLLLDWFYSLFFFSWQRDTIIDIFYEKHLGQLIEVITASCPSEIVGRASSSSVDPSQRVKCQMETKPEILSNICELLCFCVLHHPYRIKYVTAVHYVIDIPLGICLLVLLILSVNFSLLHAGAIFF